VDTACSRRCHASIKSRQTSPTGDERQTKGSQALARPTASKRVSSPPGRDHRLHVGRHRQPKSKQQASKQQCLTTVLPSRRAAATRAQRRSGGPGRRAALNVHLDDHRVRMALVCGVRGQRKRPVAATVRPKASGAAQVPAVPARRGSRRVASRRLSGERVYSRVEIGVGDRLLS
jgi:hypothetical protein